MASMLGTFSKGVKGSLSLNFCNGGGKYCDKSCKMHPSKKGGCYTTQTKMYPEIRRSLANRARLDPGRTIQGAFADLAKKQKAPPWFRFSTMGGLPNYHQITPLFVGELSSLVDYLSSRGVPIHLPVECPSKAKLYHSLVGDKVVVRLSLQNEKDFLTYSGPCTVVVGKECKRDKNHTLMQNRHRAAKAMAKARRQLTGRATMVCPGISTHCRKPSKMKCGQCKACAMSNIDVVYPKH